MWYSPCAAETAQSGREQLLLLSRGVRSCTTAGRRLLRKAARAPANERHNAGCCEELARSRQECGSGDGFDAEQVMYKSGTAVVNAVMEVFGEHGQPRALKIRAPALRFIAAAEYCDELTETPVGEFGSATTWYCERLIDVRSCVAMFGVIWKAREERQNARCRLNFVTSPVGHVRSFNLKMPTFGTRLL